MAGTEDKLLSTMLIDIAGQLHRQGHLAAADGNLSYRLGERVVITPSGVAKAGIAPAHLACLDIDGTVVSGNPSSERSLHLAVYRHCAEARAVVHAHPPSAIAFSIAKPELDRLPEGALSELVLAVGGVPIAPYARPGTPQLAQSIVPFLPEFRAIILSRHGVLCWGESLEEAAQGVERVEHAARVLCLALQMGGISELPDAEIHALKEMRRRLGKRIL